MINKKVDQNPHNDWDGSQRRMQRNNYNREIIFNKQKFYIFVKIFYFLLIFEAQQGQGLVTPLSISLPKMIGLSI